ncbi:MAG: methyltransferase domain-containing protein [Bacteroidota bacterium]
MEEYSSTNKIDYYNSDEAFNELYPLHIQELSTLHWTPIHIVKKVIEFLAGSDGEKILDIGSGVGKFCLVGAHFAANSFFYGVEQRENLIQDAQTAQKILGIKNVAFIHGNFTQLDLSTYDHFYFYNSFYENLDDVERIDRKIDYSESLYDYYDMQLYKGLQQMPVGTKVATYHTMPNIMPNGYEVVASYQSGDLTFWIKR